MKLKTVYGLPPADEERIESFALEQDDEIREQDVVEASKEVCKKKDDRRRRLNELGCLVGND